VKKIVLVGLILIVIATSSILLLKSPSGITGEVVLDDYPHYTKAICYENKSCQDYEIYCEDEELVRMVAISGAVIQHLSDWVDPRGEDADILCE
jgi:hypothetical protein